VHWHGAYIAAACAAGLQVTACHDLAYRREESDVFAKRVDLPADVVADALVGFPRGGRLGTREALAVHRQPSVPGLAAL
jgi:hypothetical protein